MAFAALAGYIVFFHTARYLIFMLVGATAVILVPVTRLAANGRSCVGGLPAGVVRDRDPCGGDFCARCWCICWASRFSQPISSPSRVCSTATRSMRRQARCSHPAAACTTGIWWSSWPFSTIPPADRIRRRRAGERARVAAGQALRETTRHDAVVGHVPDDEFLIADSFVSPDVRPADRADQRRAADHSPADDRQHRCGAHADAGAGGLPALRVPGRTAGARRPTPPTTHTGPGVTPSGTSPATTRRH